MRSASSSALSSIRKLQRPYKISTNPFCAFKTRSYSSNPIKMSSILAPHSLLRDETSFTPLFRFLDDFDTYSRHGPSQVHQRMRTFTPRFDLTETETSFELHGELPGIEKKNVFIDFTDPQTIVVKGSIERHCEAGTPPSGLVSDQSKSGSLTEAGESSPKSHHATVEDAGEGGEEKEKQVVRRGARKEAHKENGTKYWVSERSIGEFSRTFGFPTPVNQEAVSASLKDGILKIFVPKAKKPTSRRIAIN